MGIFSAPKLAAAPVAPQVAPAPPKNITVGSTPIDRIRQRRLSSLANSAGQNRTLLNTSSQPLGV